MPSMATTCSLSLAEETQGSMAAWNPHDRQADGLKPTALHGNYLQLELGLLSLLHAHLQQLCRRQGRLDRHNIGQP